MPDGATSPGAVEAMAGAIRAGNADRHEAAAGYVRRAAESEARIRAFTAFEPERFGAEPTFSGPLAGLPVAIKDIIDTFDLPTECGSPIHRGRRPCFDALVVSMIRRAGGIIAGKTVTAEFAGPTPGPTRNPVDVSRTPRGSSPGSAAAVAAGFVPFAIGTQTGGSVIRPAAFCGIAALKPSFGLLPPFGIKELSWTLDTVGLFAPDIADLAFFARALTSRDLLTGPWPGKAPSFRVLPMSFWTELSADMAEAIARATERIVAGGGAVAKSAAPQVMETAHEAQLTINLFEMSRSLAHEVDYHREGLSPWLFAMIAQGSSIPIDRYETALAAARDANQSIFAGADAILAPAAAGVAPDWEEGTGSAVFTRLWTLLGWPVVAVPSLRNAAELPLGLQVIGRSGRDRTALQAAAWLEGTLCCEPIDEKAEPRTPASTFDGLINTTIVRDDKRAFRRAKLGRAPRGHARCRSTLLMAKPRAADRSGWRRMRR